MSKESQEYDRDAALANLTDEERAALEADDVDPAGTPTGGGDDDADDNDADDNDDDAIDVDAGDDEDAGDDNSDQANGQESASDGKADDHQDDGTLDDGDGEVDKTRYRAQLPDDFNDQLKALDEREAELSRKFRSGEIEAEEFLAETQRMYSERSSLERTATKAEIAREMAEQNNAQMWQRKVQSLMRNAKVNDGIDYEKPLLGAALDKALKDLANNDEHADKSMSWFLNEAHRQVKGEFGLVKQAASADPTGKRKPDASKLPVSLANVPGSDGPGDVGSEFADIEKLDGLAYEQALAKMTPGQRERYLAAA